jgi:hypothetical protein
MLKARSLTIQSSMLRLAIQGVVLAVLTVMLAWFMAGRELIILGAIVAGIFCLWLFRNPHWGVLAIYASWFLKFSPAILGIRYFRLPYIVAIVLLFPLALRIWRDRDAWMWRVPQVRYLLAIGALLVASTWWNNYWYPVVLLEELDLTPNMLQDFFTRLVFLVFFIAFVDTPRKLKLATSFVMALILASISLAFFYLLVVPGFRRAWASFGPGTIPTTLPYVCLFAASLLWCYHADSGTKRWKFWVLPTLAGLPAMAVASGSRTAILQVLTFGMLAMWSQRGWSASRRIRSVLMLACVGLLILALVPTVAFLRSTTFELTNAAPGGHSLMTRLNTVRVGLELFASDPIFGVGIGNFMWRLRALAGWHKMPHNSYIGTLAEGGVIVLLLYLLLFYATYRMLREAERSGPPSMRWVAKGFRFNVVLLMVFSGTDDVWLKDFPYVIFGFAAVLDRFRHIHLLDPRGSLAT